MSTLDRAIERTLRETDRQLFGTGDYDRLMEKWSDAARAAAAAARRAKSKGHDWRKAARNAFAGSKAGRAALVKSTRGTLQRAFDAEKKAIQTLSSYGPATRLYKRADAKARRFGQDKPDYPSKKSGYAASRGAMRVRRRFGKMGFPN